MHRPRCSRPRARRLLGAGGLLLAAAMLVGCAPEPDPAASREALKEVIEDATPSDVLDTYDADLNPEPTVDPLDCTPQLVITARGTAEPKKKQLLGPVARGIAEARPEEVTILDLDYPADTEVLAGATRGARTLVDTLNVQAESCPEQQFVLLGYSQGALVIGDSLAAPETRLIGGKVGELTEAAAEHIVAIVFYGNPRFVGTDPTGYGNFDPELNGLLPRPPRSLDAFADRLRDYCVTGDFICQSTMALEEEGHVAYYENGMQHDGAAFVITRLAPSASPGGADGADSADSEPGELDPAG